MPKNQKSKKPFYKMPWFWIAIAIVVIGIGAVIASKQNEPTKVGESSSSSQSGGKDFKVGDEIAAEGMTYVIKSVERNYSTGNSYITPSDGKEYVKLNISITNNSNDKKSYNSLYWKVEDQNGDLSTYAMMAQASDALNSGELTKGGKKDASIVFEVPTGASLKVHIQTNPLSDKNEIVVNI